MICEIKTFPKFITHLPELFIFSCVHGDTQKVLKKIKENKERKSSQPATGKQDVSQL